MAEMSDYKWVEGYDCNDLQSEQRPDLVAYQPMFEKLNKHIAEAVELLRTPVQKSAFKNVMTKSLLEEAQFRADERVSDRVMFAVVGDMASGKSSLINSILGIGMIARKGNSGMSCTWVVQRFMKMFDDQNSPFAAKVYFFNSDEIKAILRSLIARYYRAKGKGDDSDDDDEDRDDDGPDFNEKSTVLEAMMPLFCDQVEFETLDSAMKFLETIQSEDDEVVLDQLTNWADAVKESHLKGNDFVQVAASTAAQLIGYLVPYSATILRELGRGRTQPWPLIRRIDFGLDIPILNDGVILVDSPGITDANSIRAANAKKAHRKCSHKIHVANVGRATDDRSLRNAMADNYKWTGSQNSILVLTHGEEIDDETEVEGSKILKQMERNLRIQVDDLLLRKDKLTTSMKMAIAVERLAIKEELNNIRPKLAQLSRELETCRIKMRNEYTKLSIQSKYKQLTGDKRPLPVFVVANELWNIHRGGHYEDEKPMLTVKDTGLPALRTKLYEMPAQGKLNDTLNLAEHQLPRLINSFEAFCSRAYISRKGEIEEIILHPKKEWAEVQSRTVEALKGEVKRVILNPMRADEDQWIRKAHRLCNQWGTKYFSKHLQMLKKQGFQAGRRKNDPDVDWNSELLSINRDDLEEYFKELKLGLCYYRMWDEVKEKMEEAKKNLRRDKEFNLMALNSLIQTFNLERGNASKLVDKSFRVIRQGVVEVLEEAIRCPRGGYLAKAMDPIYADVQKNKSRNGVVKQRIREFERQVCRRDGVLMSVQYAIEDAFDHRFRKELTALGKNLDGVFDSINKTFGMMCDNAVAKTNMDKQHEAALIKTLNKAVLQAQGLLDGPIKELVHECKDYAAMKAESSLFVPAD